MSQYAKWYVILWRLLWVVPAYLSRVLFVACVAAMYGLTVANHLWRDTQ